MQVAQECLFFGGTALAATNIITAAGTTLLLKAPGDARGGGITILEAWAEFRGGTAPFVLADMGPAGTAALGTICVINGAYTAAAPVQPGTPAAYFLDGGNYLGIIFAAGTVQYPGAIHVAYCQGRGGA